jgi:hypothetical protein
MTARRPGRRRPSSSAERRTHIAVADRLRAEARPGWWWSHVPSGELRTKRTAALLVRLGLKSGMSDFVLVGPDGLHHWLELKADSPLSEAQADFVGMLRARRVPCAVARSYGEAIEVLQSWGTI